jgi:hypothetical protein
LPLIVQAKSVALPELLTPPPEAEALLPLIVQFVSSVRE